MSRTVIQIEGVSKFYRLGEVSSGTISRDLSSWWAARTGKTNGPEKTGGIARTNTEVRALDNICFEVKQGEVLGIIGGNGAGKSTLLKILSRITKPTSGRIRIKGRIASLLEVGTGFHPDLTGQENIFLNGAILGMNKSEIHTKLEEIVAFAGVERYMDTPVKRYSSGMYLRLAFAVAAHLEPEIMVVDEVLAVGDADFQKKCLGKMKEVSLNQGRTVLFVSHNMASVRALCSRAIFLKNGQMKQEGDTAQVIDCYLNHHSLLQSAFYFPGDQQHAATLTSLKITDAKGRPVCTFPVGDPWQLKVGFTVHSALANLTVAVGIATVENIPVRTLWSKPFAAAPGHFEAVFLEQEIIYGAGTYHIVVSLAQNGHTFQYIDTNIYMAFEENHLDSRFVKTRDVGIILNQMHVQVNRIS